MAYTLFKIITVDRGTLLESVDFTRPVSSFVGKIAYLVLVKSGYYFTIDINQVVLYERGISLSAPISSSLSGLLTDLFVARYTVSDIPMRNQLGFYNKRLRVFNPNSYKDCKVQFTSLDTPNVVDVVSQKGFLDDLVISTSMDLTHCLVAVNGVFHKTSLFQNKLYVHDGFRTCRLTGRRDVCVVDTSAIGGHSVIPITTANTSHTTYNGLATITSNISLRNKTVFLVIDGYFYHLDSDVFYLYDDTHLRVRTERLLLLSQFRHNPRTIYRRDIYGDGAEQRSRKYSDPYDAVFLDQRQVAASTFKTAAFQLSRLTNYHSFIVVMNKANVYSTSRNLVPTGTPQYYEDHTSTLLSGMMSYGVGLCPSYIIEKDIHSRKSIFIESQDYDTDPYLDSINPTYIPTLAPNSADGAMVRTRLVDYVTA